MKNSNADLENLRIDFVSCQKIFTALSDETRQGLLFAMLSGENSGSRVIDIAKGTNLSRPAVSHHMQILKDAGLVKTRKEGTCIYYYLEPQAHEIKKMILLFQEMQRLTENMLVSY